VQRSLALGTSQGLEPRELAHGHLVLARLLEHEQPARARVEAEAARSGYATLSASRRPRVADQIAALDAWWAEHGER
jgi:hypothetical protein